MLPNMLLRPFQHDSSRKKRTSRINIEPDKTDLNLRYTPNFDRDPRAVHLNKFACRSDDSHDRSERMKGKKTNRVSNISELIQRVTSSCLSHPLVVGRHEVEELSGNGAGDEFQGEEDKEREGFGIWGWEEAKKDEARVERVLEMEMVMGQVFEAVSAMKRAYVSLQEAHCPWDPEKMTLADVAVVAELRRLGFLRDKFRRGTTPGGDCAGGGGRRDGWTMREVVAPYEAAMEGMRKKVKAREAEVEQLREKLRTATTLSGGGGRKGRSHQSKRKVSCAQSQGIAAAPMPDLFEATMSLAKEASKSFTAFLLSLMRSAHWDIAAAVRSIEGGAANTASPITSAASVVGADHAKYALESYVNRKMFQGFDHESFHMDVGLSSLLHPDQLRRDCFTEYRDMQAMDPTHLLGILPTCAFGRFCSNKYLSLIHPRMEESLLGGLEQRSQLLAGNHPRSQFYGEFVGLAKTVWLLHLLAFSLDPPPSHFEAHRGAEFHSQYMESVARFSDARVGVSPVVGFAVSPGFKLANGSIIKARVYLVPMP